MDDEVDFLSEADCPICKDGSSDKTQRRFELTEVPIAKPICVPCFYTFWTGIWEFLWTTRRLKNSNARGSNDTERRGPRG